MVSFIVGWLLATHQAFLIWNWNISLNKMEWLANWWHCAVAYGFRADFRLVPSQWEKSLCHLSLAGRKPRISPGLDPITWRTKTLWLTSIRPRSSTTVSNWCLVEVHSTSPMLHLLLLIIILLQYEKVNGYSKKFASYLEHHKQIVQNLNFYRCEGMDV